MYCVFIILHVYAQKLAAVSLATTTQQAMLSGVVPGRRQIDLA